MTLSVLNIATVSLTCYLTSGLIMHLVWPYMNAFVKDEGLLKVTGRKSGNISETVLDKDVVTADH